MRGISWPARLLVLVAVVAILLAGCSRLPAANNGGRELSGKDSVRLRQDMAEALVRQRAYDLALPYIKGLLAVDPQSSRLHLLLGVVLREKGIYKAAAQELETALRLDPRSASAQAAMGVLLSKQRRFAEAERSHRKAVALAPQRASYRNDLGFCLFLQKKYDQAESELTRAIRLDPGMRAAFNNLGFVHGLRGDIDAAERAFMQGGSQATALTNLGYLEELRGHPGAVRLHYEHALRVRRGYAPALRNLRALEPQQVKTDEPASKRGGQPTEDTQGDES